MRLTGLNKTILCFFLVSIFWHCEEPVRNSFSLVESKQSSILENGSFEKWQSRLPEGWIPKEVYNYTDMFFPSEEHSEGALSLGMSRNSEGFHYILQYVPVKRRVVYEAKVKVAGVINNSLGGGLEIRGKDNLTLGKHFFSNASIDSFEKILSTKFSSQDNDTIIFILGFPNGMNASIQFDEAALVQSETNLNDFYPQGEQSLCSINLSNEIRLSSFNKWNFDKNVEKVATYTNQVLLRDYKNFLESNSEVDLQRADSTRVRILAKFDNCLKDSFFFRALQRPVLSIWDSYCQSVSPSTTDILAEFGISTRQIYFEDDFGNGFHQFFEYWNPYEQRWVILDPFYSVRYRYNGVFLGLEDLAVLTEARKAEWMASTIIDGEANNELPRQSFLDVSWIYQLELDGFYFSEQEILNGWDSSIQSQHRGDEVISLL